MAIWPFNKKKLDQSMLPDEVSEYYKGDKDGVKRPSWVSALLTVAVTAIIAVVLFFGGKWVYQSIFGNNENKTVDQTSTTKDQTEKDNPAVNDNDTESADNTNEAGSDNDNTLDLDSTPSSSAESESTPSTGATEIPATGPGPGGLQ